MKALGTITLLALTGVFASTTEVPEITVSPTLIGLQISWTPVGASQIESCFEVYLFTHQLNGVNETSIQLEDNSYEVPFTSCSENIFFVSARCRTGAVITDTAVETYVTGLHEKLSVEDLTLSHVGNILEASWSRPANADACDITYSITVKTSDGLNVDYNTIATEIHLGIVLLSPCATFELTVTPFDEKSIGASQMTSFVQDYGNAGGIDGLIVGDERIEWTESQDNGLCGIRYTAVITDGDGAETSFETTSTFVEVNWTFCTINNIVVSALIDDNVVSTLSGIHRPRPTEVGTVEDVTLQIVDRNLLVSWPPLDVGICEVNYKLQHYVNGVLMDSALVTTTDYSFPTDFCAENKIVVLPTVDSLIGEENSFELAADSTEPEPVPNLEVIGNTSLINVAWDNVRVGLCEMQYIVEHITNGYLISSHVTTTNRFTLDSISCSSNEIRVTPVAHQTMGQPRSQFINISVDSIHSIEDLDVQETEDGLLVSWSSIIEGFCEIIYTITNFDGDETSYYKTGETTYLVDKTVCRHNKITVQGIESSTSIASETSSITLEVDIDLSKVRNLNLTRSENTVVLNWDRPLNSEYCEISYKGNVSTPNEVIEFQTTDVSYTVQVADVEPCSHYQVHVTSVSPAGVQGQPNRAEYIWYLEVVSPVRNLQNNHIDLVTWERPLNTGTCELIYNILVTIDMKYFESSTTELEFDMVPCVAYGFHVEARDVLTGLTSFSQMTSAFAWPRFLEGPSVVVHELNRETLSVSWNPANAGQCNVLYNIIHENNGAVNSFIDQSETSIDLPTVSCSDNNITITPVLQGLGTLGEELVYNVTLDLDELGTVQDIDVQDISLIESNTIELSWEAPKYSGICRLSYLVEVLDGVEVVYSVRTESFSTRIGGLIPCYEYNIRITSEYEDRSTISDELSFLAPSERHRKPTHIKTVPSLASAVVTLQGDSLEENSCLIDEVGILCFDMTNTTELINVTLPIEDNESRLFEITLANLTFNTHYTCWAQWLPGPSEVSTEFEFYTMDIPIKDLEISDVTSNEITISWDEPEELTRYVLLYTIAITTVGPNHFLQASCDVERNLTRYIVVSANTFMYTFTDALPNYQYHISIVTEYIIGLSSTGVTSVANTQPSVPGSITGLQWEIVQEECEKYSAKAIIPWTPPCDINGDLDRFEVSIITNYTIGSDVFSHTQETILIASDADENYVFAVEIPSLNPFFEYHVYVDVLAAFRGESASKVDITPPDTYAFCSK